MTFGPVAPGRPTCSSTTPEPGGTCAVSRVVAAHRAGRTRRGERSMTRRAGAPLFSLLRRAGALAGVNCTGRWRGDPSRNLAAGSGGVALSPKRAATCTPRPRATAHSSRRPSGSPCRSRRRNRRLSSTSSGTCPPSGHMLPQAHSGATRPRTRSRPRGYRSLARGSTGSCRPSWQCRTRFPSQRRRRSLLGRMSSSSAQDTALRPRLPLNCLPPHRFRFRFRYPQPARRRRHHRPRRRRWARDRPPARRRPSQGSPRPPSSASSVAS